MKRKLRNSNEWFNFKQALFKPLKMKFSIFRKVSRRNDLPLVSPKLFIHYQVLKRQSSIHVLGILLDENLSWKKHFKIMDNTTAKNIGQKQNPI